MQSIHPLRSLTMRTFVVVRLACASAPALAARTATHRDGVLPAQNLCAPGAADASAQGAQPHDAVIEAMA